MDKLDSICESIKQKILEHLENININVTHKNEEDKDENRDFIVISIHINFSKNNEELTTSLATEIYRIAEEIIEADEELMEFIERKCIKVRVSTCYTFEKKH